MSSKQQSCRTCKFAKFEHTDTGRIKRNQSGSCEYKPDFSLLSLPSCYALITIPVYAIWPDDGKDCKCYSKLDMKVAVETEQEAGCEFHA